MENKEKELFEDSIAKQMKITKKILLITYSTLGLIFIILGLVVGLTVQREILVLTAVGALCLLIGILLFFLLPDNYNYEKYKKRITKYGYVSNYELAAKVLILEQKIDKLEEQIKQNK